MKNKEVEFKFKITQEQKSILENDLKKTAKFLGQTRQIDTYYIPKFKSFEINGETMECLRIREVDENKTLCYKKIHREVTPVYCDEYELKIEDKAEMEKILFALDFEIQMVIDKTRKTYRKDNLEFDFDEVKDLGELLEVELKGNEEDTEIVFEFLKPYGLSREDVTYKGIQMMIKELKKDLG